MIGKPFFHFHNPAVVDRRARRTVDVVLENCFRGIRKAQSRICYAGWCAPILKRQSVAGQTCGTSIDRCTCKQIRVDGHGQMRGMYPDVIHRHSQAAGFPAQYPERPVATLGLVFGCPANSTVPGGSGPELGTDKPNCARSACEMHAYWPGGGVPQFIFPSPNSVWKWRRS